MPVANHTSDNEYCQYRVHMHTAPSPGSTYYRGHVDVWAGDEDEAGERAKREAYRRAFHTGLVVDSVERLPFRHGM